MAKKHQRKADAIARAAEIPIGFFEKRRNEWETVITNFLKIGDTIHGGWGGYSWSEGILTVKEFTQGNKGRSVIGIDSEGNRVTVKKNKVRLTDETKQKLYERMTIENHEVPPSKTEKKVTKRNDTSLMGYFREAEDRERKKDNKLKSEDLQTKIKQITSQKGDDFKKPEIISYDIEGFYPTPRKVVERMIELADIKDKDTIIEPSAGNGAIADILKEKYPDINSRLGLIEINHTLRKILMEKGYNLYGEDCMKFTHPTGFKKFIMNPPFETDKSILHIMHLFNFALAKGGRMVAIIPASLYYPLNPRKRIRQHFNEFLDKYCIKKYTDELPPETFKNSGTNAHSVLIVLDKPL